MRQKSLRTTGIDSGKAFRSDQNDGEYPVLVEIPVNGWFQQLDLRLTATA